MSDCLKIFNTKGYLQTCNNLDKLMFDCWRQGLKHRDILDKAQEIDSSITSEQVKEMFTKMFKRELSPDKRYL